MAEGQFQGQIKPQTSFSVIFLKNQCNKMFLLLYTLIIGVLKVRFVSLKVKVKVSLKVKFVFWPVMGYMIKLLWL